MSSGGGGDSQVIGYRYWMGLHMGICAGPVDEVQQIRVGGRRAWSGNVTTSSRIFINKPYLFGGDEKEGGIYGNVDIEMGEATQDQNDYLAYKLAGGSTPSAMGFSISVVLSFLANRAGQSRDAPPVKDAIPAYRGILGLVYRAGLVSANNPYIKPWAVKVKRITKGWHNDAPWYSAKADIGGLMNPAHIIYECLTNPSWGMGYDAIQLDGPSFMLAADTLFDESFGLGLMWAQQSTVEEFIQLVLDHAGGVLRTDPQTGKFTIKLIRAEDTSSALVLDESNVVSLDSFSRASITETANKMVVTYTDPNTGDDASIAVENQASIASIGQVIQESKQYPGVQDSAIAGRLAERDLIIASSTLARVRLTVNREGWDLRPGDVFLLNWADLGLSGVVFRVGAINTGTLRDRKITIEAAEDVFGLPASSYTEQEPEGWYEEETVAYPIFTQQVQEATYWDVAQTLDAANIDYLDETAVGYLSTVAVRPALTASKYTTHTRVGAADYARSGEGKFAPIAVIDGPIGPGDTALTFSSGMDLETVAIDTYAILGTGANAEFVAVKAIDIAAGTLTVARGVLDTTPKAWPDGTDMLFAEVSRSFDQLQRVDGETVDVKLLPISNIGGVELVDATAMSITLDQRYYRPLPPGKFQLNTSDWPTYITGELDITWAHRDRTQQTAYLVEQTEASIGPELGTTYEIEIKDRDGVTLKSVTGLTGTSYTWSTEVADAGELQGRLQVILTARRDGVTSWQAQDFTFDRAGYGLNYGLYYGAGV